jgi:hypothetical protein
MAADFSSCRDVDRQHRDWVSKIDGNLLSILAKERLVSVQSNSQLFCSVWFNEIHDVMRLQYFDKENCNYMTRVPEKTFVVFLSLEHVYQISALGWNTCDIINFVLSFLLVIWRIGNFEFLLISRIVNLHKTKLWEAVLKANCVESDAPHLDFDWAFVGSPWIYLLEEWLFDDKFFHRLFGVLVALLCLFLSELCHLKRP